MSYSLIGPGVGTAYVRDITTQKSPVKSECPLEGHCIYIVNYTFSSLLRSVEATSAFQRVTVGMSSLHWAQGARSCPLVYSFFPTSQLKRAFCLLDFLLRWATPIRSYSAFPTSLKTAHKAYLSSSSVLPINLITDKYCN